MNNSGFGNSGFKTADKSDNYGGSSYKSPIKLEIEDETARVLKEHVNLEREIENAKINLSMKSDFNLFDAFKIFDLNNNGYISVSELKLGLQDIGVYASYEEIDLIFKRYDKNRDGKFRFNEFCNALVPSDSYYASMLNRRNSNSYSPRRYEPRDSCFEYSTRINF